MTHVRDREIDVISRRVGLYAFRAQFEHSYTSHWVTLWVALTFIQRHEPIIGHPLMGGPRPEQIRLCMGTYRGILKSYLSVNWGK